MAYGGYRYIDGKYSPSRDDFVVLVWVKGKKSLDKLAEAIAAESSVGTWTKIKTMNERVFKNYRARVFTIIKVNDKAGYVFIAYPYEHFDDKNLLQILSSIIGNVFGLKELEELYFLDILLPLKFQRQFRGPLYGLRGIRRYVNTTKSRRPHVGTIVKPKVGLAPEEFAKVAYEAWVGGIDLVKDDENLVDQNFCRWRDRFDEVFEAMDKAEQETGEKKLYATNISDISIDRMLDRMYYVKSRGHRMVMLDVYMIGFSGLYHILEYAQKYRLMIHAHRAGYAAWHRGGFGVSFRILEKLYRLMGVDQLHIGTGVGKMEGGVLSIKRMHELAENMAGESKLYLGSMPFRFDQNIKPMMPVASGGLDPGKMDALVAIHGTNITAQAGGGVHGHPEGTEAGAKAMRQAAEAVGKGMSVVDYANTHAELGKAIKHFGYLDPDTIARELEYEKHNNEMLERAFLGGKITLDRMRMF